MHPMNYYLNHYTTHIYFYIVFINIISNPYIKIHKLKKII